MDFCATINHRSSTFFISFPLIIPTWIRHWHPVLYINLNMLKAKQPFQGHVSTKRHSQCLKLSLSDTKAPTYFKTLSSPNEVGRWQSPLILSCLESVNFKIQYWIAIFFPLVIKEQEWKITKYWQQQHNKNKTLCHRDSIPAGYI